MNQRTREYLSGRFRDYYRRVTPDAPPEAERREWGYIPWSEGGTTMIRHLSYLDFGTLGDFLQQGKPRHVYFSAGYYRTPGADSMADKGWEGSDLIFDLDADHLPSVTPAEQSYAEMLATCKAELWNLLEFLEDDFGFTELHVVFSGSRGYHVHVRDESARSLDREARREIAAYVRGSGVQFADLLTTEQVAGIGLKSPTEKRILDSRGGWGQRIHDYVISYVDDVLALDDPAAIERLQSIDGIGPELSRGALTAADNNYEEVAKGNIDVHPAFFRLVKQLLGDAIEAKGAAIDEPVTVDIHRLIRLPRSLHGGTGLVVTPIGDDSIADFDPLVDAIAKPFRGHEITIRGDGGSPVELNGETFTVPDGVTRLPEYVAVFLMARDRAEKEPEE